VGDGSRNHINLQAFERLSGRVSSSRVVWSEVPLRHRAYVPANRPDDGNADAALIVAARNALPHLLAAVDRRGLAVGGATNPARPAVFRRTAR